MIILHNPLDKDSRDFVAAYGAEHTILEYPACVARYPRISAFPSVIVSETATAHFVCRKPETWQDVDDYAAQIAAEDTLLKTQTAINAINLDAAEKRVLLEKSMGTVLLGTVDKTLQATKMAALQTRFAAIKAAALAAQQEVLG